MRSNSEPRPAKQDSGPITVNPYFTARLFTCRRPQGSYSAQSGLHVTIVIVSNLRRALIGAIAIAAVLQWAVVVERSLAAIWAWYKFWGYGDHGYIDVGRRTQVLFLFGSCAMASIAYGLGRIERKGVGLKAWRRIAAFGWMSITICTLCWMGLLLSPLARFYRR